ncbi:methionine import ATP-binding protein MetN 3 [Oceanobacillus oncorhynchi subsp. incaldanensis]|uniref:methionine ABC transporter ATP-binding protein n=1 Tax=Oceanobacillus oncorhynchi TaxID=545501 RepID=UPI001B28FA21|nr:ATP-binding cassette domain-containing protein [Oceanobacillus oncorhynchi]GIO19170.1 methionine import ATP-binding protein MetN 3 [Oceanobacillus oncorhynchi subsp. incaldanensis]
MISIEGLKKIFSLEKKDIVAVDNLNLNVADGDIYGVIGYSGAGKSTFVRLINRLEEPTSGTIKIGDQVITSLSKKDLRVARQDIGMIFQHFNLLWSRTVAENIEFPLEISGVEKSDRKKRVLELIELVGLAGKENAYPAQLSGGQKQRVGIARALANSPKVLLCDEATSALDPETTNQILRLLQDINEKLGLTIILITHEMHVIRKICNRVAVMEQGKVVEEGTVLDVFTRPKQPVTQKFVEQLTGSDEEEEDMTELKERYQEGALLRIQFLGESANQTVISQLVKNFDIHVNILQGKITQTQVGSYGTLIVQLVGNQQEEAIKYLEEQDVIELEVIQHA